MAASPTRLQDRTCGDCHACCHHLVIDDPALTKGAESLCRFCARDAGCTIYQHRPHACRDFLCGWRRLPLSDEWRPDRCQIIIVQEPENLANGVKQGINFLFFGHLDWIFWHPFLDFAASLIAGDQQVYISVPGAQGHWARMQPIDPIPGLKQAIATWNYAAVVSLVAAIIENCIDAPSDRIVFKNIAAA